MERQLKIYNGHIITPGGIIKEGSLLIKDGKISEISNNNIDAPDAELVDAQGRYVSPGFIDIHVHGGGGHDFMDNNVGAFLAAAKLHTQYGTTAMLPTTLTSSRADLAETLETYREADKKNTEGAQFIGMHLEGPYISPNQAGAQDVRYIRNPDPGEYRELIEAFPFIKRWSAAPELPGALEFARYTNSRGILTAWAHTDAICEEILEGYKNGYTLATHLYSAMLGVTRRNAYRYAGAVEAAYLMDDMDVEIIADGIHLPPALLKLVYKIKGAGHTALITDAMRAAGVPPGESILGGLKSGQKVWVEDGVAKMPDRTAFAGSVATFDRLLHNMVTLADVPLQDAVKMASGTPARIMGIEDKKGEIAVGKDADIVIFDPEINVAITFIKGKIMYDGRAQHNS